MILYLGMEEVFDTKCTHIMGLYIGPQGKAGFPVLDKRIYHVVGTSL